jgi:Protein of unknown function (DUF3465)
MATKGRLNRLVLAPAVLLLAACAAPAQSADNAAVCSAYQSGRSHAEVVAGGTVTRVLGTKPGVSSAHEGFLMRLNSNCDVTIRVEANVDFTGQFPLQTGDAVVVKGEYEYYARGGVIHWTHRDPRGRHEGGYIQTGGKTYD